MFSDVNIAYADLVQKILNAINKIAPFKATLPLKILLFLMKDIIVKTLHLKFHQNLPSNSRDICNFISDFYSHEIQYSPIHYIQSLIYYVTYCAK